MVKIWIQAFRKAPQTIGFSHARRSSEETDASGILEIFEAAGHLFEVVAYKAVLLFDLLLVKRIKCETVIIVIHRCLLLDEAHLLKKETLEEFRFLLNTEYDS